jgi:hypothetical protein
MSDEQLQWLIVLGLALEILLPWNRLQNNAVEPITEQLTAVQTVGSSMNALVLPLLSITIPVAKPAVIIQRDKRTMNNMSPEDRAIHIRLEQWGAETREKITGWPEKTLLGRLIEQGPMGAGQSGQPPVSLSDPAARVDLCVAKLCVIDQRALRLYYQGWYVRETLAKLLNMRERQAQNVLKRARWRVAAHLSVVEGV